MLHRRRNAVGLHPLDHRHAQLGTQVRGFAEAIFIAAPALIARDVHDRRVDVRVTQRPPFDADDLALLAQKFAIPCVAHAVLRWKTRRLEMRNATNPFIREIDRDSQSRLFEKPPLHFVDRRRVRRGGPEIRVLGRLSLVVDLALPAPAVEMFVDVGDAVFPDRVLPRRLGKVVLELAQIAVQRAALVGLFLDGHPRQ